MEFRRSLAARFSDSTFTLLKREWDSLCSGADMCRRVSSLKSLTMDTPRGALHPSLITILNDALHHNSSINETTITVRVGMWGLEALRPINSVHLLCQSLRKDSQIPRLQLRRSRSLHDLITEDDPPRPPAQRTQSCPDLLGIENMHPLLQKALGIDVASLCEEEEWDDSTSSSTEEDIWDDGTSSSSCPD